jgi:AcrR family transcriptional regulator
MRTVAEYYVRNRNAFVFSLIRVYNGRDRKNLVREFLERGINFERLLSKGGKSYPSMMQLIMAALFFCVAEFHSRNHMSGETLSDETVRRVLDQIEDLIRKGLKLDERKVAALNYEGFERRAAETVSADAENNGLLKAVAEAVAEAGPWHASMEMVARRSGLSKSGLYAHFKNKQDMMAQLFIGEFSKIANFARALMETTEVQEEQLYLAIVSIVYYLRSRPEIFAAIDWIKTRQLNLGEGMTGRLYRIIRSIKMELVSRHDRRFLVWTAKWVLFMIVNTLVLWPSSMSEKVFSEKISEKKRAAGNKALAKNVAEIPNESFRILFRFISLGLEGLNL